MKRLRHRPSERQVKGSSFARLSLDPRRDSFKYVSPRPTKFSGDFLKYIIRRQNGVGRPPAERRRQLARVEVSRALRELSAFRDVISYHGRIRPWQV